MRNNRFNNRKEELHKINGNIRAREVRLVGDNVEQGVYTINEALRLADDLELDLVEFLQQPIPLFVESPIIRSSFISRRKNRKKLKPSL